MHEAGGIGWVLNIGDLIWFNSGGSSRTALVLGFTRNNWLDYVKEQAMMKVFWLGGAGPRPSMYGSDGSRIWREDMGDIGECYVAIESHSGMPMFKVLSRGHENKLIYRSTPIARSS